MIIYSVRAESVGDFKHRRGIKTLRELAAPIVIFSDNDTRKEAVLALSTGVEGFLHSGMAVESHRRRSRSSFKAGHISHLCRNRISSFSAQ